MHRKLILVFLAVTTLASMSVAPSAFAEQKPTNQFIILNPKVICTMLGSILIRPGLEFPTPHKNYYSFVATKTCVSLGVLTNYGPLGTTVRFSVWARGCTDGPFLLGGRNGETLLEGWSSSSGCSLPYRPGPWDNKDDCNKKANDNYNKGNITVRQNDGRGNKSALGWVKFVRKLNVIKAWGKLDWALPLKKQLCFVVNLTGLPNNLRGVAVVGNFVILDPKK